MNKNLNYLEEYRRIGGLANAASLPEIDAKAIEDFVRMVKYINAHSDMDLRWSNIPKRLVQDWWNGIYNTEGLNMANLKLAALADYFTWRQIVNQKTWYGVNPFREYQTLINKRMKRGWLQ